jgi:hypothetical protein
MVIPVDEACRAALRRAKVHASQIADGVLSPFEGAQQIALELGDCYRFLNQDIDLVNLLAAIAGWADEYEEVQTDPAMTKEIEAAILDAAREFVRSTGPVALT